MPATSTKPTGTQGEKAALDYLQDALHDLDQAREKAGDEVSARIDSARDRIKDARGEMSERGHDQVKDWRQQLESAADDALEELGRWAIRAQRKRESLNALAGEITKREGEISA